MTITFSPNWHERRAESPFKSETDPTANLAGEKSYIIDMLKNCDNAYTLKNITKEGRDVFVRTAIHIDPRKSPKDTALRASYVITKAATEEDKKEDEAVRYLIFASGHVLYHDKKQNGASVKFKASILHALPGPYQNRSEYKLVEDPDGYDGCL